MTKGASSTPSATASSCSEKAWPPPGTASPCSGSAPAGAIPSPVHRLKGFDEPYGPAVRGRISAVKPGYYTRLGAGIRHAAGRLGRKRASRRLLLILSDGKPNDLDRYEGRFGIEDTRHAVQEARRQGLEPFCVTIDPEGNDYLSHLFGSGGYVVIRRPAELPSRLPLLYARLTA